MCYCYTLPVQPCVGGGTVNHLLNLIVKKASFPDAWVRFRVQEIPEYVPATINRLYLTFSIARAKHRRLDVVDVDRV